MLTKEDFNNKKEVIYPEPFIVCGLSDEIIMIFWEGLTLNSIFKTQEYRFGFSGFYPLNLET